LFLISNRIRKFNKFFLKTTFCKDFAVVNEKITIMLFLIIILLLLFLVAVAMYNRLVGRRNNVDQAFATVDVLLKKRYDLLPNLVETVKVYMNYEKDLLTNITDLRSRAMLQGISDGEKIKVENEMIRQLAGLKVAVENYPDLKASQNFINLQGSWNELEGQISGARQTFNTSVLNYNNSVQMFPSNIVANLMGFQTKTMFELPDPERQNVSAKELFGS
jgi:LemA protein